MSIVVSKTRLPVTEWQTESGSVVSIADARRRNAKSAIVTLEPTQDLHGYANPWVGGAGKNICPNTGWIQGQIQYNGSIYPYIYAISSDYIYLTAGTYTAWRSYSGVNGQLAYHTYDLDKVHLSDSGWKTNPFAIVVTEPIYIRFTTRKDTSTPLSPSDIDGSFKIQLETGSSATAWTPYSNLCPISGHSAVTLNHAGASQSDNPTSITVQLGQTVYGGSVDLVSGVGTLTRACYSCTGASSETWQKSGRYPASFYRGWNNFNGKQYGAFTCSHAVFNSNFNTYKFGQCYSDTTCSLWIQNDTSMNVTGFKALLADYYNNGNPVQVCYELATPVTFQLTPTQLAMLERYNTIWADEGDISVTYARIHS